MYFSSLYIIAPIAVVMAFILATSTIKILREYERAGSLRSDGSRRLKGQGWY